MDPEVAVVIAPGYIGRYVKLLTADELARTISWIEERKRTAFPPLSTGNQHMFNTVLNQLQAELETRQLRLVDP